MPKEKGKQLSTNYYTENTRLNNTNRTGGVLVYSGTNDTGGVLVYSGTNHTGGVLVYSGRVGSSCSTSGTRRVNVVLNTM